MTILAASMRWLAGAARKWPRDMQRAAAGGEPNGAAKAGAAAIAPTRSLRDRLDSRLRRLDEALSPRALRRTLEALQSVNDPRVSEVEAGRRAQTLAQWYRSAPPSERYDFWLLVSEQFAPDPAGVRILREDYAAAAGTSGQGEAEIRLRRAVVSPRARLLQRFAAFPEGLRFLVDLRAHLLPHLAGDPRLHPLDVELQELFATWFDVAFLELRRITWDSPASLLEKLIRYEAVHDVRGWSDMKNRLDSDRRCYGFFHPHLDAEPLIFVEVALLDEVAGSIGPLLDEAAADGDPKKATTAIFYSISNTQPGLRGVSFGDSLIKRVVATLRSESGRLRTFATLSPIPGFRSWLTRQAPRLLEGLATAHRDELALCLGGQADAQRLLAALEQPQALPAQSPLRGLLLGWCAAYLATRTGDGRVLDPVARFHLGNGALIERLNWLGDPSAKGIAQSYGLMVNYLYDLKNLDRNRGLLSQGKIPMSGAVERLYP